jgi:hypothetical protein
MLLHTRHAHIRESDEQRRQRLIRENEAAAAETRALDAAAEATAGDTDPQPGPSTPESTEPKGNDSNQGKDQKDGKVKGDKGQAKKPGPSTPESTEPKGK